jgi:hypothetical protein
MKQGSTIFSYETKEYREVGLSWAQAQEGHRQAFQGHQQR